MAQPRRLTLAAAFCLLAAPGFAQSPAVTAGPRGGVAEQAMAQGIARMVAHRAAYRLDLGEGRNSGITTVRGAMEQDAGRVRVAARLPRGASQEVS